MKTRAKNRRKRNNIESLLKELRESSDRMHDIFTRGSCVRLFFIIKSIEPDAQLWWSDRDSHAIIKVENKWYDIGGVVSPLYVKNKEYNYVPEGNHKAYRLLKHVEEGVTLSVTIEKYFK